MDPDAMLAAIEQQRDSDAEPQPEQERASYLAFYLGNLFGQFVSIVLERFSANAIAFAVVAKRAFVVAFVVQCTGQCEIERRFVSIVDGDGQGGTHSRDVVIAKYRLLNAGQPPPGFAETVVHRDSAAVCRDGLVDLSVETKAVAIGDPEQRLVGSIPGELMEHLARFVVLSDLLENACLNGAKIRISAFVCQRLEHRKRERRPILSRRRA